MTSTDPRRIAVLGTGLIGTSVAMAAIRTGGTAAGFDLDRDVLHDAAERSGLEPARSVEHCVRGADVAFVCTPVGAIGSAAAVCLAADPEVAVSDVGSVKSKVLAEVEASVPSSLRSRFVGGHPMGGSERAGPDAASATLVEGVAWVLTPASWTASPISQRVEACVIRLGAVPIRMTAERHDRLVALVSHLPQVASSALMALVAGEGVEDPRALTLAAGGFRGVARLAGSDPPPWAGSL